MHVLKDDILIDKLNFSFPRSCEHLYSHIYKNQNALLWNHNGSLTPHRINNELEFNPSYNSIAGHNLENLPQVQLKNILFDLFQIPLNISRNNLWNRLSTNPLDIVKIKRLHLTKDYICTDCVDKYLDAVKSIRPKNLSISPILSKNGNSFYFARGKMNGGERIQNFELKFYDKSSKLKQDYSINLAQMAFQGKTNAPNAQIAGCYDLSQNDILRIEIAINTANNTHMLSFADFMMELNSNNLYSRLEREYRNILHKYVFYSHKGATNSPWRNLFREIEAQQYIDILSYRTLYNSEGISKSKIKSFDSFTSTLPNKYATEIINCL